MSDFLLEMNDICKSFPGVKALDHAQLKVRPGTVHALVGENGAGKSTLMKCLFGIYSKDEGEILLNGERTHIVNPYDALKKGVAMVHQELQPIPERSVAENIYCGNFPRKFGFFVDHKKMYRDTEVLLKEVKMNFDPKVKLSSLSVSQMQAIEIAKAVSADAKIIIMDEPTSSLTQNEVDNLFEIINSLRKKGISIIYISHKMDEILSISDDVTIMRDGQYIGTWSAKELTIDMIVTRMVGRELKNLYPPKSNVPGEVVLEVEALTSITEKSFKNVSFQLRKGEILGIGGLVGAQRSELFEAIFGIRGIRQGTISYKGKQVKIKHPQDAINQGIALLTEDRRANGIFGVLSIAENVSIASLDKYLRMGLFLDHRKIEKLVQENVKKLSIKTPSSRTKIQTLSGGNQQKVIISRWLANNPDIFILDEPTRGIDVGAKYEIYSIIAELAKQGKSIIMISSELPELIGMSDRILVMCDGRVSGEVRKEEATQENIMSLATKFA